MQVPSAAGIPKAICRVRVIDRIALLAHAAASRRSSLYDTDDEYDTDDASRHAAERNRHGVGKRSMSDANEDRRAKRHRGIGELTYPEGLFAVVRDPQGVRYVARVVYRHDDGSLTVHAYRRRAGSSGLLPVWFHPESGNDVVADKMPRGAFCEWRACVNADEVDGLFPLITDSVEEPDSLTTYRP
jgi:hypothetical protein